jgi:hypothetical protein
MYNNQIVDTPPYTNMDYRLERKFEDGCVIFYQFRLLNCTGERRRVKSFAEPVYLVVFVQ